MRHVREGILGLDPGRSLGLGMDGAAADAVRGRGAGLGNTSGDFRRPHPSGSRVSVGGRTGGDVPCLFVSGHPQHWTSVHGALRRGFCRRVAGGLSRGPRAAVFLKFLDRPPRGGTRPTIHRLKAGCPHPALLGKLAQRSRVAEENRGRNVCAPSMGSTLGDPMAVIERPFPLRCCECCSPLSNSTDAVQ